MPRHSHETTRLVNRHVHDHRRAWLSLCAALCILTAGGCVSYATSKHTTTTPDGVVTTAESKTPVFDNAKEPATTSASAEASTTNSGTAHKINLGQIQQTRMLTWIGSALILVGVLTFAARFVPYLAFAVMPLGVSVSMVGAGVGFLFLPTLIERFWWVLPAGIAVWVAVSYGPAIWDNLKQRRKTAKPESPANA